MLRSIDKEIVSDLAKSIQENGLLQPILVRPLESQYEVVFGHHRLEACKLLKWETIQAMVKEMTEDDSFLTTVVENLQRNHEINPLTEARGYINLIDHGWTINKIAQRIGKSDSYVSDRIGLVRRLHPDLARMIERNGNSPLRPSHLEVLARLKSRNQQLELSNYIVRKRLSVRELERLISGEETLRETVEARGNSLYVRLPPRISQRTKIEAGDAVYVYIQGRRRIAIEPIGYET